jgi:archaellum component FlaC
MNGEDFKHLEQIIVNFKEEVKAEFRHQIGIQSEHFQHKLDIVVEGHEVLRKEIKDTREELCEKINLVDFKVGVLNQKIDGVHDKLDQKIDGVYDKLDQKIDGVYDKLDQKIDGVRNELGRKIDAVAADLSAHRRDTETHPSLYKVKEGN